jgi:hypothetical protein
MKKIFIFILPLIIIISCKILDTSGEYDNSNIGYPTTLYPLTETELNKLQTELNSLAGSQYKASLDKYGLIGTAGLLSRGSSSITDINAAVSKSKNAVVIFSKFTNVSDTSLLSVVEATNIHGTDLFNDWIVSFKNQTYNDMEVLKSTIIVLVTDDVVQITGHHYREIFIPVENRITSRDAEKSIIGMELIYYGKADPDTFIVTEDALNINGAIENTTIKILPYEKNDSLEIHVCWRVPIFAFGSKYPDWYVFVDIISGKAITYWTLFIC